MDFVVAPVCVCVFWSFRVVFVSVRSFTHPSCSYLLIHFSIFKMHEVRKCRKIKYVRRLALLESSGCYMYGVKEVLHILCAIIISVERVCNGVLIRPRVTRQILQFHIPCDIFHSFIRLFLELPYFPLLSIHTFSCILISSLLLSADLLSFGNRCHLQSNANTSEKSLCPCTIVGCFY